MRRIILKASAFIQKLRIQKAGHRIRKTAAADTDSFASANGAGKQFPIDQFDPINRADLPPHTTADTDTFKVGDKVRITLTITNSRNLEYVTLADQRAACIEPAEQISDYCIQDGLGYYMEVKYSQTNMFFNYLPKGTHIITYDAYVTNSGNFSNGIATIQCQYAPQIVAHTAGSDFNVK